jgi:polyisoprenoid-binding protein YceI
MKNIFGIFTLLLTVSLFTACSNAPKGEKVEAKDAMEEKAVSTAATSYTVDTEASKVMWTGSKPGGQHMGTIGLSNGTLAVTDGNISGGEFTIDFTTLENTDMKSGEGKEKLEGHLKTGDFFEVEKDSTGTFSITNVEGVSGNADITHNVTGNLTMKGITKSVTIPTSVAMMGDKISAQTTAFTIDRTQWGITFHSGTIAATAKDELINDQVGLVITLVANK